MSKATYKLVYVDAGGAWTRDYSKFTPELVETAKREIDQYYEAKIFSVKKGQERLVWDGIGTVALQDV